MQQQTIPQSGCALWWKVDFIRQPATTSQWLNEEKLQSTSQSQTCTQKRSWSLFGGLLPVWIPVKLLCLRSMLNKPMRCTENCKTCSWHLKGLNSSLQQCSTTHRKTSASKFEQSGLWSFASFAIFTWPLTNWLSLLQASWQLFAGKILPQPTGCKKCFPRVCWIPKHGFLCYRNNQT